LAYDLWDACKCPMRSLPTAWYSPASRRLTGGDSPATLLSEDAFFHVEQAKEMLVSERLQPLTLLCVELAREWGHITNLQEKMFGSHPWELPTQSLECSRLRSISEGALTTQTSVTTRAQRAGYQTRAWCRALPYARLVTTRLLGITATFADSTYAVMPYRMQQLLHWAIEGE